MGQCVAVDPNGVVVAVNDIPCEGFVLLTPQEFAIAFGPVTPELLELAGFTASSLSEAFRFGFLSVIGLLALAFVIRVAVKVVRAI